MEEQEFDLRIYTQIFVRRWWIFVIAPVVIGAATFFLSQATIPLYQATSLVLVQGGQTPGTASVSDLSTGHTLAITLSELVARRSIMDRVNEILDLPYSSGVRAGQISAVADRGVIRITARDFDAATAANISNATADALIADYRERRFAQIAQFQASLELYGLSNDEVIAGAQVSVLTAMIVLEEATQPSSPFTPNTRRDALLGVLLGILLAGLLAFVIEIIDDKIRSADELASLVKFPILGMVPRIQGNNKEGPAMNADQPREGLINESYNFLRANLDFAISDGMQIKSILITSSMPQEGKSTTALNLAIAITKSAKSVILVDGDLRKPSLGAFFGKRERGMTDVLLGGVSIEETTGPTQVAGLSFLPSGSLTFDPSAILTSPKMRELKAKLESMADVVIFDSPPVLAVPDSMVLASMVSAVVFVVENNKTSRRMLRRGLEVIRRSNPVFVGIALNKIKPGNNSYYDYHGYNNRNDNRRRVWPWERFVKANLNRR